MSSTTALAAEKYVAVTTYKKDGTPSSVPVWIVALPDGRLGFTTGSTSLKVKRVGNDPRVLLQPSNGRGTPKDGSEQVAGSAEVVSGADYEQVRDAVRKKYGVQVPIVQAMYRVQKLFKRDATSSDCAIVIAPEA